jgi:hypothetical protein
MFDDESVSEAWNNGFEAGISFAKAQLESDNSPSSEKQKPEHDFNCMIYICSCKKDKQ